MKRSVLLLVVCVAGVLPATPARAAAVNVVEIFNNRFEPDEIHIEPGETVTWIARDGGHTVTAEDGRFSFPDGDGKLASGDSVSWTFDEDETFSYWCKVHRPAMSGVVVVGEGSPPPPPPEEPAVRVVPSSAYPTITSALAGIEPGTVVEVQPGTYHQAVSVSAPFITIRGAGTTPDDVVLDGDDLRAVGIDVRADGVRIDNLTVRDHGVAGIVFDGVEDFRATHIQAAANGATGILAHASRNGVIAASVAHGSARAGVAVEDCVNCDVDVRDVSVRGNAVGVLVENAGSVIVRSSHIRENGAGIVLRGTVSREPRQQSGAHVWSNTILDNVADDVPPSPDSVGVGVWISSGSHDVVEDNVIAGHRYGIAVTALGAPSRDHRIVDNAVARSSFADLAWDGIGAGVCFGGNQGPEGADASSEPPAAQTIYSCDLAYTAGVPWPVVTARMLGA